MVHKALNDSARFTGARGRASGGGGSSGGGSGAVGPVGAAVGLQGHTSREGPRKQDDNNTKPHLPHCPVAYKQACDDHLA